MQTQEIISHDAYAHAYSLTVTDPNYPECGPDNLLRIAETYGVMVVDVTEEVWGVHGPLVPVYRFSGPRENVIRALEDNGWPDDPYEEGFGI